MQYREEPGDLFTVSSDYVLAHCISADCVMGAGIAKEFVKRFPEMKRMLRAEGPQVGWAMSHWEGRGWIVYNLVTKLQARDKPTYDTLRLTLIDLRRQLRQYNHRKLAMPRIGSGLDKLEWAQVREIVKAVFKDTDIEILVKTGV